MTEENLTNLQQLVRLGLQRLHEEATATLEEMAASLKPQTPPEPEANPE